MDACQSLLGHNATHGRSATAHTQNRHCLVGLLRVAPSPPNHAQLPHARAGPWCSTQPTHLGGGLIPLGQRAGLAVRAGPCVDNLHGDSPALHLVANTQRRRRSAGISQRSSLGRSQRHHTAGCPTAERGGSNPNSGLARRSACHSSWAAQRMAQHAAHGTAQHARCTCQMPRYARPMEPANQAWMRGRACTLFGRRFRGQPASCGGAAREPAALCGMAACQARPRHIPAPAHRGRSAPPVALPDAPRGGPPGSRQQGQPSPADAQQRAHICSNLKGARGAGMRCTGTPGQRHTGREVVGVCGTCDGRWSNRSLRHKLCYFLAARWP